MTDKYNAFQAFFFALIRRETEARKLETISENCHYDVKVNTFEKLQRLASEVVEDVDNVGEVSELQREAVAFVLRVNRSIFKEFLNKMHGRYLVASQFYPQCVGEYCYGKERLGLTEWTAEYFPTEEKDDAGEVDASIVSPDAPDFVPVSRFFDLYTRHICAELTARRAGIHATIGVAGFQEIRAFALYVTWKVDIFHALTVKQQIYIGMIASIKTARAFNAFHRKASEDALNRYIEEVLPASAV